jgi:hypothetical protein
VPSSSATQRPTGPARRDRAPCGVGLRCCSTPRATEPGCGSTERMRPAKGATQRSQRSLLSPDFAFPASEAIAVTTRSCGLWTRAPEADVLAPPLRQRPLRPRASWCPTARSSSSATTAPWPSIPAASARYHWRTSRPSPARSGSRRTEVKACAGGGSGRCSSKSPEQEVAMRCHELMARCCPRSISLGFGCGSQKLDRSQKWNREALGDKAGTAISTRRWRAVVRGSISA